jgi:hypothetical protein
VPADILTQDCELSFSVEERGCVKPAGARKDLLRAQERVGHARERFRADARPIGNCRRRHP